jgi:peptide/nickel transport system permease protein
MTAYIIRRAILTLISIWMVTVLIFLLLHVIGPFFISDRSFDPADWTESISYFLVPEEQLSDPEMVRQTLARAGLDKPILERYLFWAGNLLQGDLGSSVISERPVWDELKWRLPVSIELGLVALVLSAVIAVPLGALTAVKQDTSVDYTVRGYAIALSAFPNFWIATLLVEYASKWWRWAPDIEFQHLWVDPMQHFSVMWLPVVLIALTPGSVFVRYMRATMLEVLRQDYIRTARSKGVVERMVIIRHAMRNAMIPVVTLFGLVVPILIAGNVIFERFFTLPGMGKYIVDAVGDFDIPVIQSVVLVFALIISITNFLVDLSYAWIDPRIRYG